MASATSVLVCDTHPHTEPPWIEEEDGQISRIRLPDGREASPEDLRQDAREWSRAFVQDARSGMIQNHTHDCTDTCMRYANKNQKTGNEDDEGKAAAWIVPPCRFQFFVILVFTIIEGTKEIIRRVLRRGKALVTKAYIAWTNERNEHGAFVPERTHPFRSS